MIDEFMWIYSLVHGHITIIWYNRHSKPCPHIHHGWTMLQNLPGVIQLTEVKTVE